MRYTSAAVMPFMSIMLAVSGCTVTSTWHAGRITSESPSTPPVRQISKDQTEKVAKQRIEEVTKDQVESLVCEGPLEATVGATQRCVLTDGGQKAGVTLTVTKIEGDKVDFRFKIDDHLLPE
ncbi:Hypothetical protein ERS075558_00887 [Mycobacteroides abscessus]|uniref:DUF4333 domain-containing protein n=2 Tax=Mycobacteroides abscessus TaxID=36809 RepID=A0AB38D5A7_9MYCO|nr:DUF4333 domain-containing protein [Mycobacteroides abscessus]MBE5422039.1 hypothetical protein [Mycobacteroides abscessus]MBE5435276.1 hypothetical protein [Mycobacteroides abscessus]MBE5458220.1 hypothetical protein [Mycobacteroides abscessus]MBE5486375.1 hypothetical protein [Mycobacteroides abscessus]QOF26418.1 hypothetical protein E3G42_004706 [Mycobacteroides abscessus]